VTNIFELKNTAKIEIYNYIDQNIRFLPRDKNGNFDEFQDGFVDNDVDALRHAYVSGAYTMEYGNEVAETLGRLNELFNLNYSSNNSNSQNMDLWNNSIGRKYGRKAKDKSELIILLMKALKKDELLTSPDDKRKFKGKRFFKKKPKSLVIKVSETKSGANIMFFDVSENVVMTREEFVSQIKDGKYPNYSTRIVKGREIPAS